MTLRSRNGMRHKLYMARNSRLKTNAGGTEGSEREGRSWAYWQTKQTDSPPRTEHLLVKKIIDGYRCDGWSKSRWRFVDLVFSVGDVVHIWSANRASLLIFNLQIERARSCFRSTRLILFLVVVRLKKVVVVTWRR